MGASDRHAPARGEEEEMNRIAARRARRTDGYGRLCVVDRDLLARLRLVAALALGGLPKYERGLRRAQRRHVATFILSKHRREKTRQAHNIIVSFRLELLRNAIASAKGNSVASVCR